MAEVLEETRIDLDWADIPKRVYRPFAPQARTSGLHQSGLFKYLAQTSRLSAYRDQVEVEYMPLRMALGLAWEEFAVSLYPAIVHQPCEILDPLIMTCDGISFDQGEERVEEFKLTWKKTMSSQDLLNYWLWVKQAQAYCVGYKMDIARWHVCFVNGSWAPPEPVYMRYKVRFNPGELSGVAALIQSNVSRAIAAGYAE